eukprot:Gb_25611 [translate_table: standard]
MHTHHITQSNIASTGKENLEHLDGTDFFGPDQYLDTLREGKSLTKAFNMLRPMEEQTIKADCKTYSCLLQKCAKMEALSAGKNVHAHIIKTGTRQDLILGNFLINMYAKCGVFEDARKLFENMPKRNVVSFTALIAGYAQNGQSNDALNLFVQMQREGIKANHFTLVSVLKACASLAALNEGSQVHAHAHFIEAGFASNVVVGSALVDMYAKCGRIEDARHAFDKMSERNAVSWTAMIAGYAQYGHLGEALKLFNQMPRTDIVSWNAMIVGLAQNGCNDEAFKLLYQMLKSGMKADQVTFASVLRACANLAVLHHGKQVHSHIIKSGFELQVLVGSALVDMYAKCGSIRNAWEVFDKMSKRNVVSWTTMIAACAQHGQGEDALQLFEKMQEKGVKANETTFVALLFACSHLGLVDEGRHYFDSMIKEHGIVPRVEHYSCMVDLLGRAGLLDEAEQLILEMPVEPNAAVWGALLGACRIHGNIDLGSRVAKHLLQLHLQDSATYVLLSNIYAALSRWDDVAKVRKLMKDTGLKKQPGCSWIQVKHSMHVFVSGDE